MHLQVDTSSPVPPYEQIRAQLQAMVTSGALPEGTRLPPIRQLAGDLGLATNTVGRAYHELELEGLVETRGRHGTVVRSGTTLAAPQREEVVAQAAEAFALEAQHHGAGRRRRAGRGPTGVPTAPRGRRIHPEQHPEQRGGDMTILIVLVVLLVIAVILLIFNVITQRAEAAEPERWAERHGLELTPVSRPWVESYLRTGRNLRQVCALGGLVVPTAVHSATGLDLHVSGLVWVLVGYLVGCLWSELALTRAPAGTRRAASLITRRLSDYLPRRMRVAQVVLPAVAVALGALATVAYRWNRTATFTDASSGLVAVAPNGTDELLHSGARVAAVLAPLIMVVAWLAERYLIRRPQPVVDQSLVAADDALRASSVHLLGASGMAAVCLLIGSQCGYFLTLEHSSLQWIAAPGAVLGFAGAFVIFRYWRNAPWQVRRDPSADTGGSRPGPPDPSTSGSTGDSGPSVDPSPALGSGPFPTVHAGGSIGSIGSIGSATTDTLTVAPPDDHAEGQVPGPEGAWSVRRSPIPIAVAVIVIVALAGWGLRTWGGINPAVTLYADSMGTPVTDTVWTISAGVHNEARVPIEVLDVRAAPMPGQILVGPTPEVVGVSHSVQSVDQSWSDRPIATPTSIDLPFTLAGGSRASLVVALRSPDCSPQASTASFDLVLTYRTESGRIVSRVVPPVGGPQVGPCLAPLPDGPGPVDPVAAEAAVRAAVSTVYDPHAGAARLDDIDDPRGLTEADAELQAGPYAETAATTTAVVGEISFDRPDHAWFRYELSTIGSSRLGEAFLVDGRWKVARSTVCSDYALAGVTCPPLPA